jgi:hypothetical protein
MCDDGGLSITDYESCNFLPHQRSFSKQNNNDETRNMQHIRTIIYITSPSSIHKYSRVVIYQTIIV